MQGWGARGYNWEFSAGVQHELLPRVALDVGYFRRVYGNIIVTDPDPNLTAADYDRFSITAPSDPGLPGGGGYIVDGLFNIKPARVRPAGDRVRHPLEELRRTDRSLEWRRRHDQRAAPGRHAAAGRTQHRTPEHRQLRGGREGAGHRCRYWRSPTSGPRSSTATRTRRSSRRSS